MNSGRPSVGSSWSASAVWWEITPVRFDRSHAAKNTAQLSCTEVMHQQLWRVASLRRLPRREEPFLACCDLEEAVPFGTLGGKLRHARNVSQTLGLCGRLSGRPGGGAPNVALAVASG